MRLSGEAGQQCLPTSIITTCVYREHRSTLFRSCSRSRAPVYTEKTAVACHIHYTCTCCVSAASAVQNCKCLGLSVHSKLRVQEAHTSIRQAAEIQRRGIQIQLLVESGISRCAEPAQSCQALPGTEPSGMLVLPRARRGAQGYCYHIANYYA